MRRKQRLAMEASRIASAFSAARYVGGLGDMFPEPCCRNIAEPLEKLVSKHVET